MRNLKRVLALAMAFALAFSVMSGAVIYSDSAESSDNGAVQAAIDIMYQLKVMVGADDTNAASASFMPTETLSRAELTAVLFNLKNNGNANAPKASLFSNIQMPFKDVPSADQAWYRGMLGYCYQTGLISGKTKTTFDPEGDVTTLELATVLLVALGYQPADLAKGWPANISRYGLEKGLFENVLADLGEGIPRQYVAVMVTNALLATPVAKNADGTYSDKVVNLDIRGGFKTAFSLGDLIASLLVPNQYDQLAYTLFKKTFHVYTDQRAFYAATATQALTKAGLADSGKIRIDILKNRATAYYDAPAAADSNVAFSAQTALAVDNEATPLGSLVNVSYYGMIDYKVSSSIGNTDATGGVSGSGANSTMLYSGNFGLTINVIGLKTDPVSTNGAENNNNKLYTNIKDNYIKATLSSGATVYSFTGTEYDVMSMKKVDNVGISGVKAPAANVWVSLNNSKPLALSASDTPFAFADVDGDGDIDASDAVSQYAYTFNAYADRPFDTIKLMVRNNAGNIVVFQGLYNQIAKVREVTSDKVKLTVNGINIELKKADVLNADGTAFDFGAVRVLSDENGNLTTDEGLYIAYYQDMQYKNEGGKYYATKLTATREQAKSYTTVVKDGKTYISFANASGVSMTNYDPYVGAAEKLYVLKNIDADPENEIVTSDDTTNFATTDVAAIKDKTYDVIRGPQGKVLATFKINLAAAPTTYNYAIVTGVGGLGDITSPIQVNILKTDGTTAMYPVSKVSTGTISLTDVTNNFLNKLVSYKLDSGKVEITLVSTNAAPATDAAYAGADYAYDRGTSVMTTSDAGPTPVFLSTAAVVFVKKGADAWTVVPYSAIVHSEVVDAAVGSEDTIVYDTAASGARYVKVWALVDSAIELKNVDAASSVIVMALANADKLTNVSYDGSKYTYTLNATGDGAKSYVKTFKTDSDSFTFVKGTYYQLSFDASGNVTAVVAAPASGITAGTAITIFDTTLKVAQFGAGTTLYSIDGAKIVYYKDNVTLSAEDAPANLASLVGKKVGYAVLDGTKIKALFVDLD